MSLFDPISDASHGASFRMLAKDQAAAVQGRSVSVRPVVEEAENLI